MFCSKCGKSLRRNVKFCPFCGSVVELKSKTREQREVIDVIEEGEAAPQGGSIEVLGQEPDAESNPGLELENEQGGESEERLSSFEETLDGNEGNDVAASVAEDVEASAAALEENADIEPVAGSSTASSNASGSTNIASMAGVVASNTANGSASVVATVTPVASAQSAKQSNKKDRGQGGDIAAALKVILLLVLLLAQAAVWVCGVAGNVSAVINEFALVSGWQGPLATGVFTAAGLLPVFAAFFGFASLLSRYFIRKNRHPRLGTCLASAIISLVFSVVYVVGGLIDLTFLGTEIASAVHIAFGALVVPAAIAGIVSIALIVLVALFARSRPADESEEGTKLGAKKIVLAFAVFAVAVIALVAVLVFSGVLDRAGKGADDADLDGSVTYAEEALPGPNEVEITDVQLDDGDGLPSFISGTYTSRSITNSQEAIDSLQDVGGLFGFSSPSEQYKELNTQTQGGSTFYRLQQVYKGVEVYGKQLIVSANENGVAQSLSGDYDAIDSLDTTPAITAEEAVKYLAASQKEDGKKSGSSAFDESTAKCERTVIYTDDDTDPTLTWLVETSTDRWFVNASDGATVATLSTVYEESAEGTGKDREGTERTFATTKQSDGTYILADESRNMVVYDADGAKAPDDGSDFNHKVLEDNGAKSAWAWSAKHPGGFDYLTSKDNTWKNSNAVSLAYQAQCVYDYYRDTFGRVSFDGKGSQIQLFYGYGSDNAFSSTEFSGLTPIATFLVFKDSRIIGDTVAHEYTHSVERSISCMNYSGYSGALMEAYSDIFGEFYERDSSWIHGKNVRNLADPSKSELPSKVGDSYWGSTTDLGDDNDNGHVHTNCTVVSHAAYLMNQKGIGMADLEKIWYQSLYYLSSTADFKMCRSAVLSSAQFLGYGNDVTEKIKAAFDEVGISGSDIPVVDVDAAIHVYSKDGTKHNKVTARIPLSETRTDAGTSRKTATLSTDNSIIDLSLITEDTPFEYTLIKLYDDNEGSNATYTFVLRFRYVDGLLRYDVQTTFDPDTVETDSTYALRYNVENQSIALALDVSGSMSGSSSSTSKPIDEMKNAANRFGKAVFDANGKNATNVDIAIASYNGSAKLNCDFTTSGSTFSDSVNNLSAGGDTNIESGLKLAYENLVKSGTSKPVIILMSDGMPNGGKTGDDLVAYAKTLKDAGAKIYTLGFFSALDGSEKQNAVSLMERLSSGSMYHYEASNAEQLEGFFTEMGDMLSGQKYVYATVSGDVDVAVSYNGETLSSATAGDAERTAFGSFMSSDVATRSSSASNVSSKSSIASPSVSDSKGTSSSASSSQGGNVKVMRLKQGPDYDVVITGRSDKDIDCTIELMDDEGAYSDARVFESVPLSKGETAHLTVEAAPVNRLSIYDADEDKAGVVYEASSNSKAVQITYTENSWKVSKVVCAIFAVLLVALSVLCIWRVAAKRKRAQTVSAGESPSK